MMYVLCFLLGGIFGALMVCVCVSAKVESDRR
jgi:hypothetical protein